METELESDVALLLVWWGVKVRADCGFRGAELTVRAVAMPLLRRFAKRASVDRSAAAHRAGIPAIFGAGHSPVSRRAIVG